MSDQPPTSVNRLLCSADLADESSVLPVGAAELFPGPWLVLAPHPDDETFGMGGAIARARREGVEVVVIVVTDGAAGSADGTPDLSLTERRRRETVSALSTLGVGASNILFLDEADRAIQITEALLERLVGIVAAHQPGSLFFPHPFEPHPDHRATAVLGWTVCRRLPDIIPVLYEISVQGPCNRLIDITTTITIKERAMACFDSQEHGDYRRRILGLDAARSWSLPPPASHAEAFYQWRAGAADEALGTAMRDVIENGLDISMLGHEAMSPESGSCENPPASCFSSEPVSVVSKARLERNTSFTNSNLKGFMKRVMGRTRTVLRALPAAVRRAGGVGGLTAKALQVYRRAGWAGVKARARALAWGSMSDEPPVLEEAPGVDGYRACWDEGFDLAQSERPLAEASAVETPPATRIRALAFYLPQYHPIPENDAWWGRGFTEWTNVAKARPQFVGHEQPRLPADFGFYDLRVPEVMEAQIELARRHGLHGFCFHYYWFSGARLLELPVQRFLAEPERFDFPFCLCWANENWTRRWDGAEHDVLMAQTHAPDDPERFIDDLLPALRDARYIRIDGRPLLLVYRIDQLPEPVRAIEIWRDVARREGVGELHVAVVQSFEIDDPRPYGADSAVEFPPHKLMLPHWNESVTVLNPEYTGIVFSYADVVQTKQAEVAPVERPYRWFRGLFPSWDNEARKPGRGYSFAGATPERYADWLQMLCEQADSAAASDDERIVFINAWNEWGEGAYLEPDRRHGHAYLNATSRVLAKFPALEAGKAAADPVASQD